MRIIRQSFLVISIILLLSLLGYLFSKNSPKIQLKSQDIQSYNLRLFNVNWYEYDNDGKLVHSLYSPEIYQLANSNKHIILTPTLSGNKDNTLFKITANQAEAKLYKDSILLKDNVTINFQKINDSSNSVIETSSLIFHPNTQTIHTKKPVIFKNGENTIHSIGLQANLSENQNIKLGQVTGSLEPNEFTKTSS